MKLALKDRYWSIIDSLNMLYSEEEISLYGHVKDEEGQLLNLPFRSLKRKADLFELRQTSIDFIAGSYLLYAKNEKLPIERLDEVIQIFCAPWQNVRFESVLESKEGQSEVQLKNDFSGFFNFWYPDLAIFVTRAFNAFPLLLNQLKGEVVKTNPSAVPTLELNELAFHVEAYLSLYATRLRSEFMGNVEATYLDRDYSRTPYSAEEALVIEMEVEKKEEAVVEETVQMVLHTLRTIHAQYAAQHKQNH